MDALNFWAVGVPLLMFAALVGYLIGISVRDVPQVWVVSNGEVYYAAWVVQGVFSSHDAAVEYATELARRDESVRWANCEIWEFEMDVPGSIQQESVKL